jgi:uncharacterized protein (DUF302 family)
MSLVTVSSPHSVTATADRVVALLERRGIELFARIDHGGGARAADLELADEEVLIFGSPRAGTPLMKSDATIGYELPLRMLVWDHGGETRIAYRPARELKDSYRVADHAEILDGMDGLLQDLAAYGVERGPHGAR